MNHNISICCCHRICLLPTCSFLTSPSIFFIDRVNSCLFFYFIWTLYWILFSIIYFKFINFSLSEANYIDFKCGNSCKYLFKYFPTKFISSTFFKYLLGNFFSFNYIAGLKSVSKLKICFLNLSFKLFIFGSIDSLHVVSGV